MSRRNLIPMPGLALPAVWGGEPFTWRPTPGGFNPAACAVLLGDDIVAGDVFNCYPDETFSDELPTAGTGFEGDWVDRTLWVAVQARDYFASYGDGLAVQGLNGGEGWAAAWADLRLHNGIYGVDDFEGYADDVAMAGLNGGEGWAGAWVDTALDE
jgi:hypothetical protein